MTTTTTTTTPASITVTLSDRRPVRINPNEWPVIAHVRDWHGGAVECQANQVWTIRVRQGPNGRRLVYGATDAGPGGMPVGFQDRRAGYLVEPAAPNAPDEAETVRAIRRVAGVIDHDTLADACIAELPAETL